MKKRYFLLLVCNFAIVVFAQQAEPTFNRWYLNPGLGLNMPLQKDKHSNTPVENLVNYYSAPGAYISFLDFGYNLTPNWGIGMNVQILNTSSVNRTGYFRNSIASLYAERYYIEELGTLNSNEDALNVAWGAGVFYKKEENRFLYKAKLFIGAVDISVDSVDVYLKQKGTNLVNKLSYTPNTRDGAYVSITPGFSIGYRLAKRIVCNLDFSYRYTFSDIQYDVTYQELYKQTSQINVYHYPIMHNASAGISFLFEFRTASVSNPHHHIKPPRAPHIRHERTRPEHMRKPRVTRQ